MNITELLVGSLGGNADSKYALYRIPTMVVTERGTVLASFEARCVPSDNGGMDIILIRSTDGGESFSEPTVLVAGAEAGITANNPAFIVDGGRVHFLYCINYGICNKCAAAAKAECEHHGGGGVYYCYSDDDGLTWSSPVNISDSTVPEKRFVIATGPGAGIVTKDGKLIVPVWLVQKQKGNADEPLRQGPNDVATLYSTNGGATWQMGEILANPNGISSPMEAIAASLSDGRVYYNIRCWDKRRAFSVSDNGIEGWSNIELDGALIDPGCHAGLASYDTEDGQHVLIFTNCECIEGENFIKCRKNLVLKASLDDGKTWSKRVVVEAGDAGYSAVAVDKKGTVYVLYEVKAGRSEILARLNIKEILE